MWGSTLKDLKCVEASTALCVTVFAQGLVRCRLFMRVILNWFRLSVLSFQNTGHFCVEVHRHVPGLGD
jgi:hypothetical protein